jgi:hypothetical protein
MAQNAKPKVEKSVTLKVDAIDLDVRIRMDGRLSITKRETLSDGSLGNPHETTYSLKEFDSKFFEKIIAFLVTKGEEDLVIQTAPDEVFDNPNPKPVKNSDTIH